jgi:hypothetical protein
VADLSAVNISFTIPLSLFCKMVIIKDLVTSKKQVGYFFETHRHIEHHTTIQEKNHM